MATTAEFRSALSREVAEAAAAGDLDTYHQVSLILADLLEECGEDRAAARRRRKATTRRSPGVLWPRPGLLHGLSDHQRDQLRVALSRPLGLLTGCPGTGKTRCAAAVIGALVERHGPSSVAVCAPTGKAAVRITESLARYGVPVQARTIHSLLEIGRNGHDGEGWGFRRNAENPLGQRFVIVDEASMLGASLADSLLSACAPGTHVLLVGDPHQLPPVEHGAPLRDLIAAGVPCARLSEIRRNAGQIVEACAAIKDGRRWEVSRDWSATTGRNLIHREVAEPQAQVDRLLAEIHGLSTATDLDPVWDCQVLVATNRSGPLARREVNRRLQAEFNPHGETIKGNPFRVGDKIICLRNGWLQTDSDFGPGLDVYVANGEIGQVLGVQPRLTVAQFWEPERRIRIPMGKPKDGEDEEGGGTGCDFDLGYAITVHKAQGSEWPVVLILIDGSPAARMVCSREYIYTAISRASRLCVTIGRLGVAHQMATRESLSRRKTFLRELMNG